jgi:hypothetical protein
MANTDAPFGFRPSGKVGGNPDNGALSEYAIKSDYATAMFQGDLVIFNAGHVQISAAGTVGNMVFGGLKYDDSTTNKPTFKNFFDGTRSWCSRRSFCIRRSVPSVRSSRRFSNSTYPSNGWTYMDTLKLTQEILQQVFLVMNLICSY